VRFLIGEGSIKSHGCLRQTERGLQFNWQACYVETIKIGAVFYKRMAIL